MNLQTAIVEDSKPDAERLKQLLKKAFENENISCSCFASGDEFLRSEKERFLTDIIFYPEK